MTRKDLTKFLAPFAVFAASLRGLVEPVWADPPPAEKGTRLGTFEGLGAFQPTPEVSPKSASDLLATFVSNLLGFLTILAGLFFLIYFLVGGLSWLTASGKHEQVEKAKQSMTNAVIGLIIVVAGYAIAYIIGTVLGFDILNIGASIQKIGAGAAGTPGE